MVSDCHLIRGGEGSTNHDTSSGRAGPSDKSDSLSESDDESSEGESGSDELSVDDSASNIAWRCSRIRRGVS